MNINTNAFLLHNSSVAQSGSYTANRGRNINDPQNTPPQQNTATNTEQAPANPESQAAGATRPQEQVNPTNRSEDQNAPLRSDQADTTLDQLTASGLVTRDVEGESAELRPVVIDQANTPETQTFQTIAQLGTSGQADEFRLIDTFV